MDAVGVRDILVKVVGADKDSGTIDYMTEMLVAEGSSIDNTTAHDLLSPFLVELDVDEDECEATATRIVSLLKATAGTEEDEAEAGLEDKGESGEAAVPEEPRKTLADMSSKKAGAFSDPYLGLSAADANVNFNTNVHITDAVKAHKDAQREREKQLRIMKDWERSKVPLPPPQRHHGEEQLAKLTDIAIENFNLNVAGRDLLVDAKLKLCRGRRYGLIGRNGIGKTTLLGGLARRDVQGISQDVSVGSVEQELPGCDQSVLDVVLSIDTERNDLLAEEKILLEKEQTDEVGRRLAWLYARLETIDAASAPAQASTILAGLGFTTAMQEMKTSHMSGGWRMRVALARALFADPDILLLDEPTNHLDLQAVAWLSNFLQTWKNTAIVVSHARHFLNDVCTDIILFRNQQLTNYKGNYDTYEKTRADQELQQNRAAESQSNKVAHMQAFVDKFRYNAKRASLVQSRLKAIAKLPMLEAAASDPSLSFNFTDPDPLQSPFIRCEDLWFKYPSKDGSDTGSWLLKSVNFNVDQDTRMAVCGVNGSGKTTLLKLLTGALEPTRGLCVSQNRLRLGYFTQHHVDQLDLTLNAVQQLQAKYPADKLKEDEARNFLGKFGVSGMLALEPMYILSGGQKSRVAIAVMAYREPHLLVLDEPTNHLDLDAISALIAALSVFKGGVILVSHDAHLLNCVIDEVWHVDETKHTVTRFEGEFDEYRKKLIKQQAVMQTASK